MNIATIGTSGITTLFISAAKKQGLHFTAAYSRETHRAEMFASQHEMPLFFTDLVQMAKSDAFEAVYIASPNVFHYEQSKLFLEHGKHVLCEKPLTSTLEQQKKLTALADEKGLIYTEAIMSIHTPAFSALKRALPKIGKIRTANLIFCQLSSKYPAYLRRENPNIFNPAMHTGCLMDIGVYNLYLAAALFGKPDGIQSDAVFLESGADAAGTATLRYGDMLCNLVYSKVGQSFSPSEIIGDEGTISIGSVSQLTDVALITKTEKIQLAAANLSRDEVMGAEAGYFENAVRNGDTEAYAFARQTAETVRELTDIIRKDNHFPF